MCLEDVIIGMYAVGVTGLIVIAYKLFGKGKKTKQKADSNPSTNHNEHSVSAE